LNHLAVVALNHMAVVTLNHTAVVALNHMEVVALLPHGSCRCVTTRQLSLWTTRQLSLWTTRQLSLCYHAAVVALLPRGSCRFEPSSHYSHFSFSLFSSLLLALKFPSVNESCLLLLFCHLSYPLLLLPFHPLFMYFSQNVLWMPFDSTL
jgi:hypothetical protein